MAIPEGATPGGPENPAGSYFLADGTLIVPSTTTTTPEVIPVDRSTVPSGKYRTANPYAFTRVQQSMADMYGVAPSAMTKQVERLAELWARDNHEWPDVNELLNWDVTWNAARSVASNTIALGPSFTVNYPDGTNASYYNDPYRGTVPIVGDPEFAITGVHADRSNNVSYTPQELSALLNDIALPRRGGGGGGGRTANAFDKNQLIDQAREMWRGTLFEEPSDAELSTIVDKYIGAANGFWVKDGGRLDFSTFIDDKIQATDRYRTLYKRKPDFLSAQEYMAQYVQSVARFGLSSGETKRQTEAGLTSGAGLAGFTERVGRTREARTLNQGAFSQKMAQQLQTMGAYS